MKKKEQGEEVSLTIPPWSKIQAPQIGSQTPQHWFNTPLWCDAPLTKMGLQTQISRLLKSREDMISSTPDNKPHASVIHKQYCDSIPTGGHLHMQDKMSNITRGGKKPINHSVTPGIPILSAKSLCQ